LNAVSIHLPPLRERREDILLLAKTFAERVDCDGPVANSVARTTAFSNSRIFQASEYRSNTPSASGRISLADSTNKRARQKFSQAGEYLLAARAAAVDVSTPHSTIE